MKQLESPLFGSCRRRGATLVAISITVATLMTASLILVQMSAQTAKKNRNALDDSSALQIAEVGLNEAAASLLLNSSGNIGTADAPVTFAGGALWVEATQLNDEDWRLRSTGMVGKGRAAIDSTVRRVRSGGVTRPLVSKRKLDAKKKFFVDSYDSDLGTYASQAVNETDGKAHAGTDAIVITNGKLRLDKEIFVGGSIYAGPGKEIKLKNGSRTITGSVGNMRQEVFLPSVPLPTAGPSLGKLHLHGDKIDPTAVSLGLGPGEYAYTDFKVHKDAIVTIEGPATIVVEKKLDLDAQIFIDDTNGPVVFFCGKHAKIKKKSVLRVKSGKPTGLWIVMAQPIELDSHGVPKKKKKKHKVKIETSFTGVVYAPDGKVEFKKEAEVFGSVMANEVKFKKGARFHYDAALGRVNAPFGGDTEVVTRLTWNVVGLEDSKWRSHRGDPFTLLDVDPHDLPRPHEVWEAQPDVGTAGETYSAWGPDDIGWDDSESNLYDDPEDNENEGSDDEVEYQLDSGQ